MRPSRTRTVASRRTVSPVMGTTLTSVMAKDPGVSAPRDAWAWSRGSGRLSASMATEHEIEFRMVGMVWKVSRNRVVAAVRWIRPGVSGLFFHLELARLESAGLSRAEVLRMATRNGAEALGIAHDVGTSEVAKRAALGGAIYRPDEMLAGR